MNIAICDYVQEDRDTIAGYILKYCTEQLWDCHIDKYGSFEELQAGFVHNSYHMIFMDLYFSGLRGVECAEGIRKKDPEVILIFITDLGTYFQEGYRLGVRSYLIKPFEESCVRSSIRRSSRHINEVNQSIELPAENTTVKVVPHDILYVENTMDVTILHTRNFLIKTNLTLNEIEQKLGNEKFYKCHQNYIINLNAISKLSSTILMMRNGDEIPMGQEEMKKLLLRYS